jgi:hypothetical protein
VKSEDSFLCPSAKAKPGSQLLGVRQKDGTVAILPEALPVDEEFMQIVQTDPTPAEQRFRFSNKCVENGCVQWTGKSCGVIERVVEFLDSVPLKESLPPCSIRPRCRWYAQNSADACRICPYVLTEITIDELREAGLLQDT